MRPKTALVRRPNEFLGNLLLSIKTEHNDSLTILFPCVLSSRKKGFARECVLAKGGNQDILIVGKVPHNEIARVHLPAKRECANKKHQQNHRQCEKSIDLPPVFPIAFGDAL